MKLLSKIIACIACLELLIGIIQVIVQIKSYARMAEGYGLTTSQILFQEGAIAEVMPNLIIALGFFGVLLGIAALIAGSGNIFGAKDTAATAYDTYAAYDAYDKLTADEEPEGDDVKVEILAEDDGDDSDKEAGDVEDADADEDAKDDESTVIVDEDDTKDEDDSDSLAEEVRKLRDERKQAESDSDDAKSDDAKAEDANAEDAKTDDAKSDDAKTDEEA